MSELKPCPFCGGEAHISASSDGYGVECWNRRCIEMQMDGLSTEAEAIDAWNTRAERTCKNEVRAINAITPMEFRTDNFKCSACGELFFADGEGVNYPIDWAYCPNCGAKVVDR